MKNILFLLLFIFIMTGCAALLTTEQRASSLELGMTKKEVMAKMGKYYTPLAASDTPEGKVEIMGYRTESETAMYQLHLLDGKLVRWEYDPGDRRPHRPPHPH